MPKIKTKSSAKKRFKLTATGKIKRAKAGKSHLLSHKSRNRKRKLLQAGLVDAGSYARIRECLPNA
ncbi:MAG: 50S ribosomal protein L35 [Spirochaetes bacterium GWB1_36_13]|nr:MAG: 50S ribosomal protein L35 [Spirochaetes bacterium GWB1_36_13]